MHKTYLLFVCIVVAFQVINIHGYAGGGCYAPPMVWGWKCRSFTSVFANHGSKIRYSVTVHSNIGTMVCCKGYTPIDKKFHYIGCGHNSFDGILSWGNHFATPMIQCRGAPFGSNLSWTH